jgi:hypothetical protein
VKVFLSHSAADEQLASAFIDCLLSTMVLDDSEVRCTSVPGHKLPVGSDFTSTLLDDIDGSSVVVGLITPQAITSSWVLFELGATWGAKKNIKPLATDDVDFKSLPGPLSGRHVARISNRSDVAQSMEEIGALVQAKMRSAAKVDKAIDALIAAHALYVAARQSQPKSTRIGTKTGEPSFAGVPFSELVTILHAENVRVPGTHAGEKGDVEASLLELLISNARQLSDGVHSNWDRHTAGGYLYHEVGLRLLPYGLVHFDKLPAAQAKYFKRLVVSPEGHQFILQYRRVTSQSKK